MIFQFHSKVSEFVVINATNYDPDTSTNALFIIFKY